MKTRTATILQTASILSLGALVATAYAQSAPCQTEYPRCSETIENYRDVECDPPNAGEWQISDPQLMDLYACANWYNGCGGTSGSGICNVTVRYTGMGRTIYCPGTGQTYGCMESIDLSVNLNVDCNDNPCTIPDGVTDEPGGLPTARMSSWTRPVPGSLCQRRPK